MGFASLERRWFAVVFDTILPDGVVPGLPGASRVPLDRFLADFGSVAPARMLWGVRAALWFVVWLAPLLVLGRFRSFLGLGAEDRLRLLHELKKSDRYLVRELPVLLKSIACLGYCGHPAVLRGIGVAPTDTPEWAREAAS